MLPELTLQYALGFLYVFFKPISGIYHISLFKNRLNFNIQLVAEYHFHSRTMDQLVKQWTSKIEWPWYTILRLTIIFHNRTMEQWNNGPIKNNWSDIGKFVNMSHKKPYMKIITIFWHKRLLYVIQLPCWLQPPPKKKLFITKVFFPGWLHSVELVTQRDHEADL